MIRMNYPMKFAFLMTIRNWAIEALHRRTSDRFYFMVLILGLAWSSGGIGLSGWAQPAIPPLSGRVVDHAAILSPATESEVTTILRLHEDSTSNQIVVLTIASLEGAVLEEHSLEVARSWKLGQEGKNNGVLFLIAYVDRKMRIEVGYGLEGDLPDIVAKRIIDNNIRPLFRDSNFDDGVLSGVRAIVGAIEGTYEPAEKSDDLADAPLIFKLFFSLMFIGMPILSLYATVFQRGFKRWFMLVFFIPFLLIGGTVLRPAYGGIFLTALVLIGYILFQWHISRSPKWAKYREAMEKAKKTGKAVPIVMGGRTIHVGGTSSRGGSSSGGGFSGGGGSFGGGGASGGW